MRDFFSRACLLCVFFCHQALAVDFETHYLGRTDNPRPEFSLWLHLYQAQLNASLAASHYHRFLLHALLALPPRRLPAVLALPPPLTLPPDVWATQERILPADLLQAAMALALQQDHQPWPQHLDRRRLRALLSRHINWRGENASLQAHLVAPQEHGMTLTHLLVRSVLQALWLEDVRLQQLLELAQRMPTARQYGVAEQRRASDVLRVLGLDAGRWQELQLDNAGRGLLEQLRRTEQRQRRVRQALSGGVTLAAALLLSRGLWRLRGLDVRALWSKRVLGMHLGYSVTTLAALYPAWQLGQVVKRNVQRARQTPADLRGQSDYRIAYLAFLSNAQNLHRQQRMLRTLNRCLRRLQALFAEGEINLRVNTQHNRYRIEREEGSVSIAVPYSASSDVHVALQQVIASYYGGQFLAYVLPADVSYCYNT